MKTSRGYKRHNDGFFFRSKSFFYLATEIERLDGGPGGAKIIDAYGSKSLHQKSHGESFWTLFMKRLRCSGLYILDEPEATMSPTHQMALLCKMHELISLGSQFIITTHSPILIAYPESIRYEFSPTGIANRKYKETDLYKAHADFIKDGGSHVRFLLQK